MLLVYPKRMAVGVKPKDVFIQYACVVKVQQHNANTEEIALAACEVSHHIQSSAAHLQSTARFGSKLLEDSATKLHSVSLTEIRDRKFTDHAESTPQIRMPKFRGGGPQVVERPTSEH